jgi:hypothetical protein
MHAASEEHADRGGTEDGYREREDELEGGEPEEEDGDGR